VTTSARSPGRSAIDAKPPATRAALELAEAAFGEARLAIDRRLVDRQVPGDDRCGLGGARQRARDQRVDLEAHHGEPAAELARLLAAGGAQRLRALSLDDAEPVGPGHPVANQPDLVHVRS
jgi:hypothetical protein